MIIHRFFIEYSWTTYVFFIDNSLPGRLGIGSWTQNWRPQIRFDYSGSFAHNKTHETERYAKIHFRTPDTSETLQFREICKFSLVLFKWKLCGYMCFHIGVGTCASIDHRPQPICNQNFDCRLIAPADKYGLVCTWPACFRPYLQLPALSSIYKAPRKPWNEGLLSVT